MPLLSTGVGEVYDYWALGLSGLSVTTMACSPLAIMIPTATERAGMIQDVECMDSSQRAFGQGLSSCSYVGISDKSAPKPLNPKPLTP